MTSLPPDPTARPRPGDASLAPASGLPKPRLWRSRTDRVLAGVLGGLAEKFGWETGPLRGLYAALTLFTGVLPMVVLYGLVWAITDPRGAPARAPLPFRRSSEDRVWAGVLGGLAERFGIAPWLVRGLYAVGTALTGGLPGIVLYLLLWTVTPERGVGRDAGPPL